jgi:hypothetical protein
MSGSSTKTGTDTGTVQYHTRQARHNSKLTIDHSSLKGIPSPGHSQEDRTKTKIRGTDQRVVTKERDFVFWVVNVPVLRLSPASPLPSSPPSPCISKPSSVATAFCRTKHGDKPCQTLPDPTMTTTTKPIDLPSPPSPPPPPPRLCNFRAASFQPRRLSSHRPPRRTTDGKRRGPPISTASYRRIALS